MVMVIGTKSVKAKVNDNRGKAFSSLSRRDATSSDFCKLLRCCLI